MSKINPCLKAKPKELHIGECIGDLEAKYLIPANLVQKKFMLICKTCKTVYDNAVQAYNAGDEEKSYIYFMKFFNVLQIIRSHPDYAREKSKVNETIGVNKDCINELFSILEELKINLVRRYKIASERRISTPSNLTNSFALTADILDSLPPIPSEEPQNYFLPATLYQQMNNRKILIIDCRPAADYKASRLRYEFCVNICEETITPGKSAGMIISHLSDDELRLWSMRMVKEHVILMDWSSKAETPVRDTPLWVLMNILLEYDPDCKYKSLLFLKGGYEEFILMYPTLCTNSNVKAPRVVTNDYGNLEEIEYPSFNDITMKDDAMTSSGSTFPLVNRSTKAAALKVIEKNRAHLSEILEEEEKLTDKSLNIEKKRLEVETNWKTLQKQTENVTDEDAKVELVEKEQEMEYAVLQLENEQRDIDANKNLLRQTYKEQKEFSFDDANQIKDEEAEALNRMKQKEEEARKIKEKNEFLAQEREQILAKDREQKQKLKKYNYEMPTIPVPPKFDRTVKPVLPSVSDANQNIYREFSPTYGSQLPGTTGLRNLGNTCYMNSIVQCLSNTNALVDYFTSGAYRKHLNPSSKTRGLMAEELAAVIRELWRGKYKYISSRDFRYHVGQFEATFRGSGQQDSHEFLTILIDWMHLDLETINFRESEGRLITSSQKAWIEYTKSKESKILQLFYGQIKSTVKCVECSKESATYETFSNLSLELPSTSSRCDIEDCMGMYFHGENISGWSCPSCKQNRRAVKKLDISKWPPILVIHFKRFSAFSDSTPAYKKKQNYIQFPLHDLDLAPYIAPSEIRSRGERLKHTYNLYAVSNHYGSMESGHYTAFSKNSINGKWFKYDDHIVSQLDPSDVKSSAAYILFYTNLSDTIIN